MAVERLRGSVLTRSFWSTWEGSDDSEASPRTFDELGGLWAERC